MLEKEKERETKEKDKDTKADKKQLKKAKLEERCLLNRGTSFILTVEKKVHKDKKMKDNNG